MRGLVVFKRPLQVSYPTNNLTVRCCSVSDDMTMWKWSVDGEAVSTKQPLNISFAHLFQIWLTSICSRNKKLWTLILQCLLWTGSQARVLKKSWPWHVQTGPLNSSVRQAELKRMSQRHIKPPLLASNGVTRALWQRLEKTVRSEHGPVEACSDLRSSRAASPSTA